jgi:hypothetical protein
MKASLSIPAALLLLAVAARAAPNLPFDHPDWVLLRDARARGLLADPVGGQQGLGEDEVQRAIEELKLPVDPRLLSPRETGFWLRPVDSAALEVLALHEHDRPYSLPARPRDLVGQVGFSCEQREGRPCGGGVGLEPWVQSSAGFGTWVSATARLRLYLGNNRYASGAELDRAYVKAQLGPLALEVGRDVIALGPSASEGIQVSRSAAPFDQIRAWTRPLSLIPDSDALRVSFFYFIARLRDPQFYEGAFVDCTRMQIDLFRRVQLGGTRLLQFGGTGAPPVDPGEFVHEHFARDYDARGAPVGDNRLAFDAAVAVPELAGGRFYTEVSFEDFRQQELNVFRYDADYLLGAELRALSAGPLRRLLLEAVRTGRLSQEGLYWKTGWSNAGRPLGSALGPDALSLYLRGELELSFATVAPWLEAVRYSSDTYRDDGLGDGGIRVDKAGPAESRGRAGLDLSVPLQRGFLFEASLYIERVTGSGFVPGQSDLNAGVLASLRYLPRF